MVMSLLFIIISIPVLPQRVSCSSSLVQTFSLLLETALTYKARSLVKLLAFANTCALLLLFHSNIQNPAQSHLLTHKH